MGINSPIASRSMFFMSSTYSPPCLRLEPHLDLESKDVPVSPEFEGVRSNHRRAHAGALPNWCNGTRTPTPGIPPLSYSSKSARTLWRNCYDASVATCKSCGDEAEQLVTVKVGGKSRKVCEDCADRLKEEAEVAEQSESVVQSMMGFKGRR